MLIQVSAKEGTTQTQTSGNITAYRFLELPNQISRQTAKEGSAAEVVANYYLYCSIAEQRDDVWNPASAKLSHHQVTSCFKSYKVGQVQKEKCVARLE